MCLMNLQSNKNHYYLVIQTKKSLNEQLKKLNEALSKYSNFNILSSSHNVDEALWKLSSFTTII